LVKNGKQSATTLKSDPSEPAAAVDHPCRLTAVAVGDVGSHPAGGVGKDTRCNRCDTELKLVLFACGGWHGGALSPTGHLFHVFQAANDRR